MEDKKIDLETALLAKEKGFDLQENCICGGYPDCICDYVRSDNYIYKPTQSLLQKWLREVHNIHIYLVPECIDKKNEIYLYNIKSDDVSFNFRGSFLSFEEQLEQALKEALKLIKDLNK